MTFKEAFLFYVEYIARATQGKRRLPKTGRALTLVPLYRCRRVRTCTMVLTLW